MLKTKEVEVNLKGCQHISYFIKKGYIIPYKIDNRKRQVIDYNKKLIVKIEDLPQGSHTKVEVLCDYCGKSIFSGYKTYIDSKNNSIINKDSCGKCKTLKTQESLQEKYGVSNYLIHENFNKARQKQIEEVRHDYDFIFDEFKKANCELITKEYYKNIQPLDYICELHRDKGIQTSNYASLKKNGSVCDYCRREKISMALKNDFDDIFTEYDELGYILLDKEYIDCHTPMKCLCKKHSQNPIWVDLVHARRGHGCEKCYIEKVSGENHWNWKGGISSLSNFIRYKIKFWVYDSLKNNDFKCFITNINNHNLIVHHLYGFNMILDEVLHELKLPIKQNINEYTSEELLNIENLSIDKHYNKYGLGVPLIEDIHNLFHNLYGNGNNTSQQFEEFKQRYYNFEFDDLLEDKYKYKNTIEKAS